jgi:hypothetical protein
MSFGVFFPVLYVKHDAVVKFEPTRPSVPVFWHVTMSPLRAWLHPTVVQISVEPSSPLIDCVVVKHLLS